MTKIEDILAQLKDIHLPRPIHWWPLAPGWYILLSLILIVIVFLGFFFYRKMLHARPKKEALRLLRIYQKDYEHHNNAQKTSAQISQLLKRVALVYYPRSEVASLVGDSWIKFLNQSSKSLEFDSIKSMLVDLPFNNERSVDLKPLIIKAQLWIGQRRKPC